MRSRRDFLMTSMAAGLGASALRPGALFAAARGEIKTTLNGPVGLQLWSLREQLKTDVPGTLAKVHAMGFRRVEGAGLWGQKVEDLKAALQKAGLSCPSAHMGMERLRDDLAGALKEAKALGATDVVCPWIPHEKTFTREDALKAAESFNRFGKAASEQGMSFGYHCHGYDMAPDTEGTLFDTLAKNSDAKLVHFQIDTFHAYHGGGNPTELITRYKDRVRSLHLKDMKKGLPVETGKGTAPPEFDVPVGSGQIDFPTLLKAAAKAGVSAYYVEDESTDPLSHIPQSVAYLEGVKL
jgi:sugar phosphate isomerase/epimerase